MNVADVVGALSALSHETRLAIHGMLVEAGPKGMPAGIIAERLGIPPSSLTFHLQQLLRAGLATQRRASRQLIYAADLAGTNGLVSYLTENCCGRGEAAVPACDPARATSIPDPSGRTGRMTA